MKVSVDKTREVTNQFEILSSVILELRQIGIVDNEIMNIITIMFIFRKGRNRDTDITRYTGER